MYSINIQYKRSQPSPILLKCSYSHIIRRFFPFEKIYHVAYSFLWIKQAHVVTSVFPILKNVFFFVSTFINQAASLIPFLKIGKLSFFPMFPIVIPFLWKRSLFNFPMITTSLPFLKNLHIAFSHSVLLTSIFRRFFPLPIW